MLQRGALLALCEQGRPEAFCTVEETILLQRGTALPPTDGRFRQIILFNKERKLPIVGLSFEREALKGMFERASSPRLGVVQTTLVPASNNFFAVSPVLKALQHKVALPFADELLHAQTSQKDDPDLPLSFVIPPMCRKEGNNSTIDLEAMSNADICAATTLDPSQVEALRSVLTRSVSRIQGPPGTGTGKTFLGGLVSEIIVSNSELKFLCLCYTNHALDQFRGYLLDRGIDKIVRLGSRSKDRRLASFMLNTLARTAERRTDRNTQDAFINAAKRCDLAVEDMKHLMEDTPLGKPLTWAEVQNVLIQMHPQAYNALSVPDVYLIPDEDGFQTVGRGGHFIRPDTLWDAWISGQPPPRWAEYLHGNQMWQLPLEVRTHLCDEWVEMARDGLADELADKMLELKARCEDRETVKQAQNILLLQGKRVLGCTTTGAAIQQTLVEGFQPDVIIVEEAGEVLEAHVMAALSKTAKSLVFIGDHKQLRPKVDCYRLRAVAGAGYDFDVSLFERLI
eukprot:5595712-Prymnesium_polylepis.1